MEPLPPHQEVLAGLVERVTYHNAENGFCVLRAKARGHRDLVTLVGHAATIAAGEWITASGEWINDRTHGRRRTEDRAIEAFHFIEFPLYFRHQEYLMQKYRVGDTVAYLPTSRLRQKHPAGTYKVIY